MKKKNTLMYALALVIVLGAVVVGYFALRESGTDSSRKPDTTQNGTAENPEETGKSETGDEDTTLKPDEIIKDSTLTKELGDEKIVEIGQIYVRGGIAYGAIVVRDNASNKEARKVAEKYMEKLKKKYKDMKINVQVVRNGENIVNLTHGF